MPGRLIVAGHRHVLASQRARAIPLQLARDIGPFLISLRHLDPIDLARRRPRGKHQEKIMHPAIMRQFAAEHIREKHARAEDERRARQARQERRARRRALSTRPRLPASGTLSPDDPRLDTGRRPAMHEPPSAPPEPVLAGSPPDSDDAVTRREALDHCR
jgi:hypothetical protein